MDKELAFALAAVVVAAALTFIGVLVGMLYRSQQGWMKSISEKLDVLPTKENVEQTVEIRVLKHENQLHGHIEGAHL